MPDRFWPKCKGLAQNAAVRQHLSSDKEQTVTIPKAIYPEQINLPFNFAYLKDTFELCPPSTKEPTLDLTQPGFWSIIQGNSVVLVQGKGGLALPEGDLPSWLVSEQPPICLGNWRGKPLRAFSISSKLTLE